jgi:hypothetical protein
MLPAPLVSARYMVAVFGTPSSVPGMRMNPHRLTNPNTVASHRLVTMEAALIDAFEDKYNEFMESAY